MVEGVVMEEIIKSRSEEVCSEHMQSVVGVVSVVRAFSKCSKFLILSI